MLTSSKPEGGREQGCEVIGVGHLQKLGRQIGCSTERLFCRRRDRSEGEILEPVRQLGDALWKLEPNQVLEHLRGPLPLRQRRLERRGGLAAWVLLTRRSYGRGAAVGLCRVALARLAR